MGEIKRFATNGYKIYDTFYDGVHWLVNEVEAEEIVTKMNNLDTKARERGKHLSKLQKENEYLKQDLKYFIDITTLTKAIELLNTIYDKYLYASPSDTIAEAKRKGIKECMDTLENYLEDLDV